MWYLPAVIEHNLSLKQERAELLSQPSESALYATVSSETLTHTYITNAEHTCVCIAKSH